jgi:hypothetical protein
VSKAFVFNANTFSVSSHPGFALLKALWSALCFVASKEASGGQCSSRSQYKLMGTVGADSPPFGGKIPFRAFSSLSSRAGLRVFGSSGLRVFGSSGLRVFGSSGLRVFWALGQCSPVVGPSTFQSKSQVIMQFKAVGCSVPNAVSPNPSVKGTSCGKPQAAPYVER